MVHRCLLLLVAACLAYAAPVPSPAPPQQVPLVYQPTSQLFCVRAIYESLDARTLKVRNYANDGAVNGRAVGTSNGSGPMLTARIVNPKQPAKLQVGFSLGRRGGQVAPGPYWVIAAGANPLSRPGTYDWAIVSGGKPTTKGPNGCQAPTNGLDGGLWLFSRLPQDAANTQLMLQTLQSMGLDTSALVPVQQAGCLYQES
ncbi:hypothetical protein N2152v2_003648 [Parachlorella kessleri]